MEKVNINARKKYLKKEDIFYTVSYIFDPLLDSQWTHQELSERKWTVILGISNYNVNLLLARIFIQNHSTNYSFRIIQTHPDSSELIQTHSESSRLIRTNPDWSGLTRTDPDWFAVKFGYDPESESYFAHRNRSWSMTSLRTTQH